MHVINRLYSAEFDFPPSTRPSTSYMIATIPRSGSTYFALKLWETGVLGAPLEYLNLDAIASSFLVRFNIGAEEKPYELDRERILDYWNRVKALRTSPNGVFGYKMFMIIFHKIINTYHNIFSDIQPDYVIYLTRRDLIGQAISYSKAKLTKTWFADVANAPVAHYDFQHVLQCKKEIELQCTYWEGVFSTAQIDPIRVTYEDLLDDERKTIGQILDDMEVDASPPSRLSIPMINKQADDSTDEWRERFLEDSQKIA